MYPLVEDLQVGLTRSSHVVDITARSSHQGVQVGRSLFTHARRIVDEPMAEFGQLCVIDHIVCLEPPLAQQRSYEGSNQTTHVDEDIENLEARVALALGDTQCLRTLLGRFGLEVVVHLTDNSLQISLEETITKGDEEEGQTGERQQPHLVVSRG